MIRLFAAHPTAGNILMILLIGLGLAALPSLQRDSFPEVPPSDVEVRIAYPGAAPAEVEAGICLVAEDPIRAVENLAQLTCQARDNMAVLTAEIVERADMTRFAADVKRRWMVSRPTPRGQKRRSRALSNVRPTWPLLP